MNLRSVFYKDPQLQMTDSRYWWCLLHSLYMGLAINTLFHTTFYNSLSGYFTARTLLKSHTSCLCVVMPNQAPLFPISLLILFGMTMLPSSNLVFTMHGHSNLLQTDRRSCWCLLKSLWKYWFCSHAMFLM